MKLDDVKVTGDVGGTIDASSAFLVSDVGHLTDFTKVRSPILYPVIHSSYVFVDAFERGEFRVGDHCR